MKAWYFVLIRKCFEVYQFVEPEHTAPWDQKELCYNDQVLSC